jgi:hypothetical protein
MRLALPPDYETLLKAYPSKLRSQIKRAQKEGMDVRVGGEELLEDYYRVFARCMRDLGTPVYAKGFFQSIVETFPKECDCEGFSEGSASCFGLLMVSAARWRFLGQRQTSDLVGWLPTCSYTARC